jgi:hypothetical protein
MSAFTMPSASRTVKAVRVRRSVTMGRVVGGGANHGGPVNLSADNSILPPRVR